MIKTNWGGGGAYYTPPHRPIANQRWGPRIAIWSTGRGTCSFQSDTRFPRTLLVLTLSGTTQKITLTPPNPFLNASTVHYHGNPNHSNKHPNTMLTSHRNIKFCSIKSSVCIIRTTYLDTRREPRALSNVHPLVLVSAAVRVAPLCICFLTH